MCSFCFKDCLKFVCFSEILCSLQRTLNDLISTVIAWLPMNKLGSHISRHFDDSSAPCDGRLVAMLIALDLELLWITLAPKVSFVGEGEKLWYDSPTWCHNVCTETVACENFR